MKENNWLNLIYCLLNVIFKLKFWNVRRLHIILNTLNSSVVYLVNANKTQREKSEREKNKILISISISCSFLQTFTFFSLCFCIIIKIVNKDIIRIYELINRLETVNNFSCPFSIWVKFFINGFPVTSSHKFCAKAKGWLLLLRNSVSF
jgi:hypothetical protein